MESDSKGAPYCLWRVPAFGREACDGKGGFHCLIEVSTSELARAALTALAVLTVFLWRRYSSSRKIAAFLKEYKEETSSQLEVLDRLVIEYEREEGERSSSVSAKDDVKGNGGNDAKADGEAATSSKKLISTEGQGVEESGSIERNEEVNLVGGNGPTTKETSRRGDESNPNTSKGEGQISYQVDVQGGKSEPTVVDNSSSIASSSVGRQQNITADGNPEQAETPKSTLPDGQGQVVQVRIRLHGEPESASKPTESGEESDDLSRTSSLAHSQGVNGSSNEEVLAAIPTPCDRGGSNVEGEATEQVQGVLEGVVLISSAVVPPEGKHDIHENGTIEGSRDFEEDGITEGSRSELSTNLKLGESNEGRLLSLNSHHVIQEGANNNGDFSQTIRQEISGFENGVSAGKGQYVQGQGTEDVEISKRQAPLGQELENGHGCLENGFSEGHASRTPETQGHNGDATVILSGVPSICENGFSGGGFSSKPRYEDRMSNGHVSSSIVSPVYSSVSHENDIEHTESQQEDRSNSCRAQPSEHVSSICAVTSEVQKVEESKKVSWTEDDVSEVKFHDESGQDSPVAVVSSAEHVKNATDNSLTDLKEVDNENDAIGKGSKNLTGKDSKSKSGTVGKNQGRRTSPEKSSPPVGKVTSVPKGEADDENTNVKDKIDAQQNGESNGDESGKGEVQPRRTAPITLFLPSPLAPDKDVKPLMDIMKKISVVPMPGGPPVMNIVHGSFMETLIEVNDKLMGKLADLLIQGSKFDKLCSIQLDSRAILQSSEKGIQVLKLGETSVPAIISVEYAAGVLVIKGFDLEGAVIKASFRRKTITLNANLREKKSGGMVVMSCVEPMPSRDIQEIFIYASKGAEVEGRKVTVVSQCTFIKETHLETALRDWMPTAVMAVLITRETWMIIRPFIRAGIQYGAWILPAATIILLQFLPSRTEDFIGEWVRSVVVCSKLSVQGALRVMRSKSKLESSATKPPPPPPGPKPAPPVPAPPTEAKPKAPEKPITDLDWQWPSFDEYVDKGLPKLKEHTATPDAKNSPFQAIYKREADQQWADVVSINFNSPILIKIVQSFLPHKKDMLYMEKPSVKGKELFLIMDQLIDYTVTEEDHISLEEKAGLDMETCKLHLYHLVRFVKKEYNDVSVRFKRMRDEKSVSWDMLWAFLGPGTKVAYTCSTSEEKLLAKVKTTNFQFCAFRKNNWTLNVVLEVYDYNGENYRKCNLPKSIDQFDGEHEFVSLDVCPVQFTEDPEDLEESCIQNGRKFREYVMTAKHRYVHYKGPMFQLRNVGGMWALYSVNADGRVMIDLESFAKMNPKYPMGNAKPSSTLLRSISNHVPKAVMDNATDENLLYAPAIVYGFSFSQKQWGAFTVSGFTDIKFNGNAWEELVMESEEKALMYNLVSQYIAPKPDDVDKSARVDPISNKGEGCIFLCYGPPGTGKTLTAESVAEKLERPLWALSVSELGTSADKLETSLVTVLDIAASWRAVLLLDEADVYLELRKTTDIHRNAMTGVFLRLLEYYRGVLFLTTNRVLTFDDAFLSRISMFLNYKKLEQIQRQQIWSKLLRRAGVVDLTPEFVFDLSSQDHQGLNGRAIRNVVQTAQTWAKSKEEPLSTKHIKHVLKVTTSSLGSLHSAMGMVDLTPFYYT